MPSQLPGMIPAAGSSSNRKCRRACTTRGDLSACARGNASTPRAADAGGTAGRKCTDGSRCCRPAAAFAHCSIISSNWSTIMSQNSRALCWRCTIARRVVDLGRIGHAQQRTRARAHPDRLVVARPVHQVFVAGLLQQIGRRRILVGARAHPAFGRRAFVARERVGDVLDRARLVGLPSEVVQVLGVGAAVRDDFVLAAADRLEYLRRVLVQPGCSCCARRAASSRRTYRKSARCRRGCHNRATSNCGASAARRASRCRARGPC